MASTMSNIDSISLYDEIDQAFTTDFNNLSFDFLEKNQIFSNDVAIKHASPQDSGRGSIILKTSRWTITSEGLSLLHENFQKFLQIEANARKSHFKVIQSGKTFSETLKVSLMLAETDTLENINGKIFELVRATDGLFYKLENLGAVSTQYFSQRQNIMQSILKAQKVEADFYIKMPVLQIKGYQLLDAMRKDFKVDVIENVLRKLKDCCDKKGIAIGKIQTRFNHLKCLIELFCCSFIDMKKLESDDNKQNLIMIIRDICMTTKSFSNSLWFLSSLLGVN
ncbi:CLUMA_CG012175, isoform A [Clunio marinus]|uniref:CLUMA_CG012175, isoform A n=1 Tax=Clunio marinus TaxID=568069 RepID=A0A1J1IEW2_9DIPT|nr:CLUMA_CG012175, isoform A [Clunio marinus]